jgi:hypothetical protein
MTALLVIGSIHLLASSNNRSDYGLARFLIRDNQACNEDCPTLIAPSLVCNFNRISRRCGIKSAQSTPETRLFKSGEVVFEQRGSVYRTSRRCRPIDGSVAGLTDPTMLASKARVWWTLTHSGHPTA